jgi:uroporphyrinogen-III decarboxylase
MPYFRRLAAEIKKPWIYHSDGNITKVLDDLLSLGMNAIHPIQPDVMDIYSLKKTLGQKVTMVGNVDLNLLTLGSVDEVKSEVRRLMENCGVGGRYILSSSNSLANFLKLENISAMGEAKRAFLAEKFGL